MSDSSAFSPLVPGFDFLQNLVKNAGASLPGIGQWVAPTLNPEELEKRINELRTIQFWLEQNARMLGATIQALEVQRMTLATLKTMNVQMSDLRDALKVPVPPAAASTTAPAEAAKATGPASPAAPGTTPPAGAIDPLQWWGALTQQFTELAATAVKESTEAAKHLAPAPPSPTATPAAAPDAAPAERSSGKPTGPRGKAAPR